MDPRVLPPPPQFFSSSYPGNQIASPTEPSNFGLIVKPTVDGQNGGLFQSLFSSLYYPGSSPMFSSASLGPISSPSSPNNKMMSPAAILMANLEYQKKLAEQLHMAYKTREGFHSEAVNQNYRDGLMQLALAASGTKKRQCENHHEFSQSPAKFACIKEKDEPNNERCEKPEVDNRACTLRGERRLVIIFEDIGECGPCPQTFGKSGALIPDGVCGTHTVYNERWRFEIAHGNDVFQIDKLICVCITWKITNLTTGTTTSMTETRDEAVIRNSQGQTISNKVFREALESRARDLEERLEKETNPKRVAQLQSLIKALRPKRFSEGPLIFGLQHRVVQEKMQASSTS